MSETNANDATDEREHLLNGIYGANVRGHIADRFAKWCDPVFIGRMLTRYELMKRIVGVHGSIIECGCRYGDGLLQWFQISRKLEPLARRRIIYGFDTFAGLASVDPEKDGSTGVNGDQSCSIGGARLMLQELMQCIALAHRKMMFVDMKGGDEPPLKISYHHPWQQIKPVAGDFMQTGPMFMEAHPHLVVALLYLDFDLYHPTNLALELFLPRMSKGSIIMFDELDHPDWPGETRALEETIGIRNLRIERFPWEPSLGFAVLN